ncbi:hypothetical protein VY88_33130 [Azospirillum thiophilum]|uniref:Uncharacterized protein n=1 Tax=Azospirillum thiophilum TaxID=528244 RepID=A0AAC8ZWU8_9PROT|nr:hypothetical protein AL072_33035 [Azospirillum thiophilum]KJR61235.1 hypothetical protein VY88_33130 [Azospirillum thiophilum]
MAYGAVCALLAFAFFDACRLRSRLLTLFSAAGYMAFLAAVGAVGMGWLHLPVRAAAVTTMTF